MMNSAGVFKVSYQISSEKAGTPVFNVDLVISAPDRYVSGEGKVRTGSEMGIETNFFGDFSYMSVIPKSMKILVMLAGETVKTGKAAVQNTIVRMVLEDDWETGIASFSFIDHNGKWKEEPNAVVIKVETEKKELLMKHLIP